MKIFLALFNIENNAHSVEKSAYKNKPQGQRINLFYHRFDSDYNYPAHCDIAYNRRLAELFKVNGVQHMPRIAAPQTIPKRTQPNAPLKGTRVIGV